MAYKLNDVELESTTVKFKPCDPVSNNRPEIGRATTPAVEGNDALETVRREVTAATGAPLTPSAV